jgi:DNA-binding Lrp family transcriptional regulator
MVLTERDKRLTSALQSYAILTTRQLAAMIFPSIAITTVLRRLRVLEAGGYIQRIEGLKSTERAWGLTERKDNTDQESPAKVHFPRHSLDHDLKLTELRIRLEGKGIALSWIPEHEVRAKVARAHGFREAKRKVIPDGIAGVEVDGVKESMAVELELNFKNSRRYWQIFQDYQSKKNLYAVWYVVASKGIGRHLEKAYKECYPSGNPFLFWSILDDVMSDPIAATIHCAGETFSVEEIFARKEPEPAHPLLKG